mgnify:CR=1 FL=1
MKTILLMQAYESKKRETRGARRRKGANNWQKRIRRGREGDTNKEREETQECKGPQTGERKRERSTQQRTRWEGTQKVVRNILI